MEIYTTSVIVLLACLNVNGDLAQLKEETFDRLEHELIDVIRENNALGEKLSRLQEKLKAQDEEEQALVDKISELERVVQHQNTDVGSLKTADNGETGAETMTSRKREINAAWVGFSAVLSKADVSGLTPGQPIVFDKVITNMADANNASTGRFTAPNKGFYGFNMAVLVEPGHNEYLEFVKDGNHVMYNYVHARGSLHDESSSRTVVLELDAGSQVWVQTTPSSQHGSGTIHGNDFSTFSGWLLAYQQSIVNVIGK